MKTIAFFNNKGGVGKTSLVYHLAWMYADLGLNVVAADLDPQANLTTMFLAEDRLEELWFEENAHSQTVLGSINPILEGIGDIAEPHLESITKNIGLIVGDLGLSLFEDNLSTEWSRCLDRKPDAFRTISAFYRILFQAFQRQSAEIVLIDVGPNLGAINRAALIAADYVVIPLAPDLFSLQGLKNLGPRLRDWRMEWEERLNKRDVVPNLSLPTGQMQAVGYVILQHSMRSDRPVKAYGRWMDRMPQTYRQAVLNESNINQLPTVAADTYCLATLKNYRSLMPMAMEVHKPMFHLKPADGAIGTHMQAVSECYTDFKKLANIIAKKCNIQMVNND
jgi:chromosome partitioning protein